MQGGQDSATDDDKIEGIIAQTRGDISQGSVSDVAEALQQRFLDSQLELSLERFARALAATNAD